MGAYSAWNIEAKAGEEVKRELLKKVKMEVGGVQDSYISQDDDYVCYIELWSFWAQDNVDDLMRAFATAHPDCTFRVTAEFEQGDRVRFLYQGAEHEVVSEIRIWEEPERIAWEDA